MTCGVGTLLNFGFHGDSMFRFRAPAPSGLTASVGDSVGAALCPASPACHGLFPDRTEPVSFPLTTTVTFEIYDARRCPRSQPLCTLCYSCFVLSALYHVSQCGSNWPRDGQPVGRHHKRDLRPIASARRLWRQRGHLYRYLANYLRRNEGTVLSSHAVGS